MPPRRRLLLALIVGLIAAGYFLRPTPSPLAPLLFPGVQETVLPNGLRVLTQERPDCPVVALCTAYGVGSRDEENANAQVFHLLEHLTYRGSRQFPDDSIHPLLRSVGAAENGRTANEYTTYYETLAPDHLDLALQVEADRMHASTLAERNLAHEKQVVTTEALDRESKPEHRLDLELLRTAFPGRTGGRYMLHRSTDVDRLSEADVRRAYHTYYGPNNATLALVGRFRTAAALELIRKRFGALARISTPPPFPPLVAASPGQRRVVLRGAGAEPIVELAFPCPEPEAWDAKVLDVMRAALDSGSTCLFSRDLVGKHLATEARSLTLSTCAPGFLAFRAVAAPGVSADRLERALRDLLAHVRRDGITAADLRRACARIEAQELRDAENPERSARRLASSTYTDNGWRKLVPYLRQVRSVTNAEIRRAARGYLPDSASLTGWFLPTVRNAALAAASPEEGAEVPADSTAALPRLPPTPPSAPVRLAVERFRLPNGITVLVQPDHSSPTVTVRAALPAGSVADPPDRPGVARLTSQMLRTTARRSGWEMTEATDALGASLVPGVQPGYTAVDGWARRQDLNRLLDFLAEMLQSPRFTGSNLDWFRSRDLMLQDERAQDPAYVADLAFQRAVFPEGYPLRPQSRDEEAASLARITLRDIQDFYNRHYGPSGLVVVLVGDVDGQTARAALQARLGRWFHPTDPPTPPPPLVPGAAPVNSVISMADRVHTAVVWGHAVGLMPPDHPDYYSARVLTTALGGSGLASRLSRVLRVERGLTYSLEADWTTSGFDSAFRVHLDSEPRAAREAAGVLAREVREVRDHGLTSAERDQAVGYLAGQLPVSLATPALRAEELLAAELAGEGPAWLERFPARCRSVTLAQVNDTARRLLHPDRAVLIMAGAAPR